MGFINLLHNQPAIANENLLVYQCCSLLSALRHVKVSLEWLIHFVFTRLPPIREHQPQIVSIASDGVRTNA